MPHKSKLLSGNSRDIIDTNIKILCDHGYSKGNATRVALRKAKKKNLANKVSQLVSDLGY